MAHFRDREDAGRQLAQQLKDRPLRSPLVLAIPPGGLLVGAVVASALNAELDVVLARRVRVPGNPRIALGAVDENGELAIDRAYESYTFPEDLLAEERDLQWRLLAKKIALFRAVRPRATPAGRSVVVVDDGIATGTTMIAALEVIRKQAPFETIVAVPVCRSDRHKAISQRCDLFLALHDCTLLRTISLAYDRFELPVDAVLARLLASHASSVT